MISSLRWTVALEEAEQVAELGWREFLVEVFWHKRGCRFGDGFDLAARDHRALVLCVDEGQCALGLVRDQSGQDAAIAQRDDVRLIFLADHAAWVNQAHKQIVAVHAVGVRQVGTDLVSLAEEAMAGSAALHEQLFPLDTVSRGGAQVVVQPAHFSEPLLGCWALDHPPVLAHERIERGLVKQGDLAHLIERDLVSRVFAMFDSLEVTARPRRSAQQKSTRASAPTAVFAWIRGKDRRRDRVIGKTAQGVERSDLYRFG